MKTNFGAYKFNPKWSDPVPESTVLKQKSFRSLETCSNNVAPNCATSSDVATRKESYQTSLAECIGPASPWGRVKRSLTRSKRSRPSPQNQEADPSVKELFQSNNLCLTYSDMIVFKLLFCCL